LSPRYPLRRRKTISQRYRHISRQQPSLNVNIYHANRVERFVSPLQHQWTPLRRQIGINSKYKDLEVDAAKKFVRPQSKTITCHINEHTTNQTLHEQEKTWKEQCSLVEVPSKPMDHCPEYILLLDKE